MRQIRAVAVAIIASVITACGGSSDGLPEVTPVQHPILDQDYSSAFTGIWAGSGTTTIDGASQFSTGSQLITRTGANKLSIYQMCSTVDGTAGVDDPTHFTIDPIKCPAQSTSCGDVTIAFYSGRGTLSNGALTITLAGKAAGCGKQLDLQLTFTGSNRIDPLTSATPTPSAASLRLDRVSPSSAFAASGAFTLTAVGDGFGPQSNLGGPSVEVVEPVASSAARVGAAEAVAAPGPEGSWIGGGVRAGVGGR